MTTDVVGNNAGYCFDLHLKSIQPRLLRLKFNGKASMSLMLKASLHYTRVMLKKIYYFIILGPETEIP
jgi:hypothetical protein